MIPHGARSEGAGLILGPKFLLCRDSLRLDEEGRDPWRRASSVSRIKPKAQHRRTSRLQLITIPSCGVEQRAYPACVRCNRND